MNGQAVAIRPGAAAPRGWWLFIVLAAAVSAVAWTIAARGHFDVGAIRHVIRATAQMSLGLFCTAFAASAVQRQWPGAFTSWLRRHRRYFGLSFAWSHAIHAVAIAAFATASPPQFHEATDPAMFLFGGLAYVFIVAMAATSFDRTAAWLSPRAWRILHVVGAYDIWITFLIAEGKRALHQAYYWPYVALLIAVLVLRLAAMTRVPRAAALAG